MRLQYNEYAFVRRVAYTFLSAVILAGCFATAAIAEKLYDDASDGTENTERVDTANTSVTHNGLSDLGGDLAYYGINITSSYGQDSFINSGEIYITGIVNDYLVGINNFSSSTFLENTGDITVLALPSADQAQAVGIYSAGGMQHTGSTITVTATGGTVASVGGFFPVAMAYAHAYGIYSAGAVTSTGGAIYATANGGSIVVSGLSTPIAQSYGIYSKSTANNSSTILATATGASISADSDGTNGGNAYGISALSTVTNSGAITAVANGGTYSANGDYSFVPIDVIMIAEGYGIKTTGDVSNSGAITVEATGGEASTNSGDTVDLTALAYGIYSEGELDSTTGTISATASGGSVDTDFSTGDISGKAYGVYSESSATNSSNITVSSSGGTVSDGVNGSVDAKAYAYGIKAVGDADNSGTITATAAGGTVSSDSTADAYVYGIHAGGDATNNGAVIVTATGGTVSGDSSSTTAASAGADAYAIMATGAVSNSHAITVAANGGTITDSTSGNAYANSYADTHAYGIKTDSDVTNSGAVTITANGGMITDSSSSNLSESIYPNVDTYAYGIAAVGAVNNSGSIIVTASGGIIDDSSLFYSEAYAYADGNAFGIAAENNIINSGDITVTAAGGTVSDSTVQSADANADAFGVSSDNSVTNSGSIIVSATGGTASSTFSTNSSNANSYGIKADDVTNSASITVTATGGTTYSNYSTSNSDASAYGIKADNDVTNSGNITVSATGGAASDGDIANANADAYGIDAVNTIINSGDITVTATGGTASADSDSEVHAYAYGIRSESNVSNSAAITVRSIAGDNATGAVDVKAYGIYFNGTGSHSLDSTGVISVSAEAGSGSQETYQVYVNDGTLSISSYAMEFEGAQDVLNAEYSGVIKHESDPTSITFNNATLYAHTPETIDATYTIPTLVEGATASNQFASVVAVHPDVAASLIDGAAGENQQIEFSYEPEQSTTISGLQTTQAIGTRVNNTVLNQLVFTSASQSVYSTGLAAKEQNYARAATVASDSNFSRMVASLSDAPTVEEKEAEVLLEDRNTVFLKPVYVYSARNDSSGYTASSYGILGGYTRRMDSDVYLGVHGGYSYTNVNYLGDGYTDREEEINTGFAGLHGGTVIDDRWYVAGVSSFFYGKYYLRDSNPLHRETAKHDALTVRTSLRGGYVFPVGEHRFLPELGLTHTWQHSDSYSSDPESGSETATIYGTLDNHELYGTARLSWYHRYDLDNGWSIFPSLGVGVTQLLTDGKISNTLSLASASQQVVDEEDYTTFTPFCSLSLEKAGYFMIFAYEGGFSDRVQNSLLSFQFGVGF